MAKPARVLELHALDDLKAELGRVAEAHTAGTLTSAGAWTPAQNIEHVAKVIRCSLDGFPFEGVWWMRMLVKLMGGKKAALSKPFRSGFKIPKRFNALLPAPGASFQDAMADIHALLGRLDADEKMTHPSPVLGPMTHEEWVQLHLRHAALHLGFLRVE